MRVLLLNFIADSQNVAGYHAIALDTDTGSWRRIVLGANFDYSIGSAYAGIAPRGATTIDGETVFFAGYTPAIGVELMSWTLGDQDAKVAGDVPDGNSMGDSAPHYSNGAWYVGSGGGGRITRYGGGGGCEGRQECVDWFSGTAMKAVHLATPVQQVQQRVKVDLTAVLPVQQGCGVMKVQSVAVHVQLVASVMKAVHLVTRVHLAQQALLAQIRALHVMLARMLRKKEVHLAHHVVLEATKSKSDDVDP